jgi:predicted Rdx family selenoprotein
VRGDDGIFDVVADGDRIFCKDDEGRFPSAREIVAALRSRAQRS